MTSPFLALDPSEWVAANPLAFAVADRYPVSPGHTLVVPRRHVPDWWSASRAAQAALLDLVAEVKALLDARDPRPDGYNDVLHVTSPLRSTGGSDVIPSRYRAWSCTPSDRRTVPAGVTEAVTEDDRAATYEGAFAFQPISGLGFSGHALSGYNESVKVRYTFDIRRDPRTGDRLNRGYMCGDSDVPAAPGQRVQGFQRAR